MKGKKTKQKKDGRAILVSEELWKRIFNEVFDLREELKRRVLRLDFILFKIKERVEKG